MMKKNTTNLLKKYAAFVLSGGNTGGKQAGVRESVPRMTKFLEDNELFYREGLAGRTVDYFCEISEAFKKKNLRFFSIKSFRSYDYADKDLDIVLVDKGRRNEYINTLEGLGFRFLWNRSVLREPYKRFYVKEGVKEGENLPKIHVHFAVSWNGMEFLDSEGVWKRLKSMNVSGREVMVPSPEDEILIMSAHSMYENGYVTVGELLHLKNVLSQSGSIDVERMLEESKRYNWRRGLKSFFALAEAYYGNLTGEELFPDRFGDSVKDFEATIKREKEEAPPYFFPRNVLLSTYVDKVSKDICSGKLLVLPRELFTFGLVVWLFREKKRAKFKQDIEL